MMQRFFDAVRARYTWLTERAIPDQFGRRRERSLRYHHGLSVLNDCFADFVEGGYVPS